MKSFYVLFFLAVLPSWGADSDPMGETLEYKRAQTFIQEQHKKTASTVKVVQALTQEIKAMDDPQKALTWSYALRRLVGSGEGVGGLGTRLATPEERESLLEAIRVGESVHGLVNGWYDFHFCTRLHRKVYGTEETLPGAYSSHNAADLNLQMKANETISAHLTQVYAYARAVQLELMNTGVEKKDVPLIALFGAAAPEMPIQLGLNFRKTLNKEETRVRVDFTDSVPLNQDTLTREIQSLALYKTLQERMDADLRNRQIFSLDYHDKRESRYLMWVSPNGSCAWYTSMLLKGVYGYYEPYDLMDHYRNSILFFPWKTEKEKFKEFYSRIFAPYIYVKELKPNGTFQEGMEEYRCLFSNNSKTEFFPKSLEEFKPYTPEKRQQIFGPYDIEAFNFPEVLDLPPDENITLILTQYPPLDFFWEVLASIIPNLQKSPLCSMECSFVPSFLFDGIESGVFISTYGVGFLKKYSSEEHMALAFSSQKPSDPIKQVLYLLSWKRAKIHEDKRGGSVTPDYIDSWHPELNKK